MPTSEQLLVWRKFTETTDRLNTQLASRMQADSALSMADYQVLLALSEAPGGQYRSSELATKIEWERSRLSHHLNRMERRGLISRAHCTVDHRGSEVLITPAGADAFRRGTVPHLRDVHELFLGALCEDQLAHLAEATSALEAHLDAR